MIDHNPSEADPFGQIADEFVEAFRQGKHPSVEEFARRYPEHADEIREMLPALALMERAKFAADGRCREPSGTAGARLGSPGLQQLGDYQILREVGRGGMGVVYEAQQLSLGRHVAIKVLPSHALLDPRHLGRFQREARSAARLHHTNIVPVFGVGEQDGLHYYVMQFIHGLGLDVVLDELQRLREPHGKQASTRHDAPGGATDATRNASAAAVARGLLSGAFTASGGLQRDEGGGMRDDGRQQGASDSSLIPHPSSLSSSATIHLPGQSEGSTLSESGNQYWQSVARVGMQVADALDHAASQGILHRDIKPSNLLLDETGNVWVTDFGLAKADDGGNLTYTGDIVGTMRYMAPERFNGQGDLRSDVYSLGLTLYELVTLRPAFNEDDRNKLVKEVMYGDPVRPRKLNPAVPRDLETVVLKAIARLPSHRYQTPAEMAEDLKRFVEDRPVRARRISGAERLWRWCRRNPIETAMAAAVILALVMGTTVSYLKYLDAEKQKGIALEQQARAEAGEREAQEQRTMALRQQARAEAGEQEAKGQRIRADSEAEATRQNLYYTKMHLAQQAWREHRGLGYMRELLAGWLPRPEARDRRGWEWFYLNSLPYQNLRTLTESGVRDRPCMVAWHRASKQLAEGTADGLIRVWDVDRERTTLVLKAGAPVVGWWGAGRWLAWSPDGKTLAAGCTAGTVHVWEVASGRQLHVLRGHKSPICCVAFSSDGNRLASWGQDGTIKIHDAGTGRPISDVSHPSSVTAGAWSPDGKLLACGHNDGTVTLSGVVAGDRVDTLRGHVDTVFDLAFSRDSTRLVSTSGDFTARIWEAASGKMVLGPLRHSHGISCAEWDPDGKRLATGSVDETAKIWNAVTGQEVLTLRGHIHTVNSLSWGPDGSLASGCCDGSMKIWNSIRNQEANVLTGNDARVTSVAWSPDGKRLASGGDDGKVWIWDPAGGKEVRSIRAHDVGQIIPQFGLIRSLAWSPDSTHLASAGLDGAVKVWEVATGREVFALPADRGSVWAVAWSSDGKHLAAGSQEGTIRVVTGLKHTPKVHQFRAHQGRVRSLAWSPQGDRLASGGGDGLVKLWDPSRGAELVRMPGHQYWVMSVAWSPDGKQLASASGDRLVMTWDAQTGRPLSTMRGHNDFVDAVVWSPDGTRLASAGLDNSVRLWDPRTAEEAFVLRGRSGMFHDVSWHRDGAQLAAASSDGQVYVWDATRGFERDSTARAWPYIERKLASGTARYEDRLAFAQYASDHKQFARAARLWAEALAGEGKLGDDRQTHYRYGAIRAAVLAADGQALGEPPLDDTAKAKLRGQALHWLRVELTAWRKFLDASSAQARPNMMRDPSDWKQDPDLASIRDDSALARLPADERKAFAQLWADVARLDSTMLLLKSAAPPLIKIAALQAWFGQHKELAATCARTLRIVADTKDPTTAERTAKICSLHQTDDRTHEAALVLARRAVELGEGHPYLVYFRMALGMAEYRSGHYAEADKVLLDAARYASQHYHISITSAFYRAMALFRLGKETEARKLAIAATARMRPLPADEKKPLDGETNADDLILWMAYKEAKAMIKFDAQPPGKGKKERK
jgi:WD40 repeat protein/serine/threonine protein kinase